jgi:streptogramin lyase
LTIPSGFQTCSTTNMLSAYATMAGSNAGSGTVQLLATGSWTASSNTSWLQLAPGSTNGVGNAVIQFSYFANPTTTVQTGTLTIGGLTFTVTQAGTNYVPVISVNPLVSTGLNSPHGVAVDTLGNTYIADTGNNAAKEWSPYTQEASEVVSSGLMSPTGVAADPFGSVYIADSGNHSIESFNPSKYQFTTLVSGLGNPSGVAVDGQDNVYFSDASNNAIQEWTAATQQVSTLVGSGLNNPTGVALDSQGNVYFADSGNNAIKEWNASSQQMSTLISSGLSSPTGIALDGLGNVYIADTGNNAIKEWNFATQQVTLIQSAGLNGPGGIAVDGQQNIYVADTNNGAVDKLTPAYLALNATSRGEPAQAGSDSITFQVLPIHTVVTASSNQSWLTITSTANGAIAFSFSANISLSSRSAQITVLGQTVTVTQSADVPTTLTKIAGAHQSTFVGQPFALQLRVRITDSSGNALVGVPVMFTVTPAANGASGTFNSTPAMPVLTDAYGRATAPILTANSIPGTFGVAVTAGTVSDLFGATITSH